MLLTLRSVVAVAVLAVLAQSASAQEMRAQVVRVQQFHNQMENGQKGMILQLDLEVDGCQNHEVHVAAYFEWKDGRMLTARPGKYSSSDGQVTTQRRLFPQFAASDFKSLELFLPYDELSLLVPGSYDFRFYVQVHVLNGGRINTLISTPVHHFNLKQN